MSATLFRPFTDDDLPEAHLLYLAGLDAGHASFDLPTMPMDEFQDKLNGQAVFALETGEIIQAIAWLGPVSSRSCYAGVWEVSIYVHPDHHNQGLGKMMLGQVVDWADEQGIWTLQAAIFPENTASLALFGGADFRIVGVRKRIGKMLYGPMAGIWRDTALLERRSKRVI